MDKQREFKVGDKVVPHNKSIGRKLKESIWRRKIREGSKPHLFIIDIEGDRITLWDSDISNVEVDRQVDRLIEEKYGSKEREVNYLEAREIIRNGGKVRAESTWSNLIYFREEDRLKYLDVADNSTHLSSGLINNIISISNMRYYVVEESKKNIEKPIFDKSLKNIQLKTDLKLYSAEELRGELEKRNPKGSHPSELVGKRAVRIQPRIRKGGFDDDSFMTNPIEILKVTDNRIYCIHPDGFGIDLKKEWLDNNWIEYEG